MSSEIAGLDRLSEARLSSRTRGGGALNACACLGRGCCWVRTAGLLTALGLAALGLTGGAALDGTSNGVDLFAEDRGSCTDLVRLFK